MTVAGTRRASQRGDPQQDWTVEELWEAVRARDEFVAIAAHELRNPMTPILMQAELLLAAARNADRCRPEVMAPRLELLSAAIADFVRRSTTLLDISRIATGNIRIEPMQVDFSALVQRVIARQTIAVRLAQCTLEPDLQPGVHGLWDPMALEQVVENLLTNAIKFGAGKPVAIQLRSDGKFAELVVRDQGIGISPEDRQRIFERFERVVTRREHGGFGLGLWLSHKLVVAMRGTLHVESVVGAGTTFIVTLPHCGAERQETGRA